METIELQLNNNTEWIYERLGNISRCLNGMHWRYDITGFNEDLQYTKNHGYVKGLTNVFVKNLKDIEPKERPICCSNVEKKQFYIK